MSCASNSVRFDSLIPHLFLRGFSLTAFPIGIELDEDVMRPRTP
jgi:hypothetical protein